MRRFLIAPAAAVVAAAALFGCESSAPYHDPYPERVYYYEPWGFDEVWFFDDGHPEVVERRTVYVERDRTYYVEKGTRVYFDDGAARARRRPGAAHAR
jgi:hypothetical protein